MRLLIILVATTVLTAILPAQEEFPHNELSWSTIETAHFLVHFHDGAQRTAREIAHIAESVYKPVTDLYQHEPDQKVSLIIRDHDDYSNGAAYFFDNRIVIYAPALDFELRGIHPWLWNVITHEFTHIVQIQTALKFGRRLPAVYLQWLGYEAERRPDVLYGYPNVLISYPFSGFVVPSWFAEGVAQFNGPHLGFDYWDTHRDMILRMYMLDGSPLSWEDMAVFGKTSLGNESSYNAGFSLVNYIAKRYGMDALRSISRRLADPLRVTIGGAIQEVLGISGQQLYDEWKTDAIRGYRATRDSVGERREGTIIEGEGFGNGFAAFSPDGGSVAYVSNKGEDYFSRSSVYAYSRATKSATLLIPEVRSTLSYAPDGNSLYYSKASRDNPGWSLLNDLYRYDIREKAENRLTKGLRSESPSLSRDGAFLVFAYGSDGTLNVGIADTAGGSVRAVTHFANGEQVYTPVWSPDGQTIAFGYSQGSDQSIALVDRSGEHMRFLPLSGDARTPRFAPDGRSLYFSWDTTGIFNIYRMDLGTGSIERVTNVLGGAFSPAISTDGALAFGSYTVGGYKLAILKDSLAHATPGGTTGPRTGLPAMYESPHNRTDLPSTGAARSYRTVFTSLSFIPILRVDNYTQEGSALDRIKPGLFVASGDVLDKMNLFLGATINRRFERDVFLSVDYRDRLPGLWQLGLAPTLTGEFFNVTRKTQADLSIYLSEPHSFKTGVTYDLMEADLSLTQPIVTSRNTVQFMYSRSRYQATLEHFFVADPVYPVESQAFTMTYLISDILSLRWRYDGILPTLDRDINPVGRSISFRYGKEWNRYNRELQYDYSSGIPKAVYIRENFHRLEGIWNEHLRMPFEGHTLTLGFHGGTIQGMTADTIFNFYAGGVIGMKGYPFYSIEGNQIATFNLTYRFPVFTAINARVLQFYFTKLYASAFGDVGNAWNGPVVSGGRWKRDVGAELRLEATSFYAFPTRIFLSGAYGLDRFTREFRSASVTYGNEWRFYFGILFGFDLTDMMPSARRFSNAY